MTPEELVRAVRAAGARVEALGGGRAKIVGQVPQEVLAGIRAEREAFLEAWTDEIKGRYGSVPPADLVLRTEPPVWRSDVYCRVETYVRRQGEEVCLWATLRATAYQDAMGWSPLDCCAAAWSDVLHWQMERFKDPESQLAVFEEVASHE